MRRRLPIVAPLLLLLAVAARAQQLPEPHAGYVYPAGGRQGSTFEATVGGQFLDGVSGVLLSGEGVSARILEHDRPLNGRALNDARQRLQELQKSGRDPAVQKEITALRERVAESIRRLANPAISERVRLEVAIAARAAAGTRSLRLVTPIGLSDPLVFCVGDLQELREKDAKNAGSDSELTIDLPATVNGRIVPGDVDRARLALRQPGQYMPPDVDRYRFVAHKGQDLVVEVSARGLMPYLADAVPGWFQATVALLDANLREVAYEDDYRFHPDPVLHYRVPADGEYVVEIKDALYRGREDFVYRIAIGELPFVTGVFPLGGRTGDRTKVTLTGWNLPVATMTIDARHERAGVHSVTLRAAGSSSNTMPFAIDDLKAVPEREPNDSARRPQQIRLPAIVDGRIRQSGDTDVFSFNGRAGERIVADVRARRLESPLDSVLELTDSAGRRLAFDDDREDKGMGWLTHHADSQLSVSLPSNGAYFLRIRDAQHKGGLEYTYRLRVSAPRPDFDLRIAPSSINLPGAGTIPITVHALRKDDFDGDIGLALKGAPDGFVLSGATIPAGQDHVRLTLTAPALTGWPGPAVTLRIEGRAVIGGRTVVHEAVPADDMMQAFAYHHLVPADALRALVISRGATRLSSRVAGAQPLKLQPGAPARIRVEIPPAYRSLDNVRFELSDPPDGITAHGDTREATGTAIVVEADGHKARAGLRGNLIITISGERTPAANPKARRRVIVGTLPAIPFEIADAR